MGKILTDETNLESLKSAISKCQKEIFLISAWMRSETLKKIFPEEMKEKIKNQKIKIFIIIRLSNLQDLQITDTGVFKFVEELGSTCEIRYNKNLHTKLYIIDDFYASIGSYNLTGGGFGDDKQSGYNIETGIEIKDKGEIQLLKHRAIEIWEKSKEISESLIGFTLNETTNTKFNLVGIKPLESGKFVEIKENNSVILGQIGEVKKYNFSFFNPPELENFNRDFADIFSNNEELSNKIKGIVFASNLEYGQLNIAEVQILSRIYKDNCKLIKDDNRFAPDVGCEVYTASKEILENLFYNPFCHPAVLNSNKEVKVGLNPDEILSKHMAVFGTTGSGKSYFVKYLISKFLSKYITEFKKGRIIIFDPHGEYTNELDEVEILNRKDWEKYLTVHIETADDLIEYFKLDRRQSLAKNINEIFIKNKKISNKNIIKILKENDINEDFIAKVKNAINERKISFNAPPEYWKDFEDNKVYCVNLKDCDDINEMWRIISKIMTGIFNHVKSVKNFPVLFVIEEAHNFVPEGADRNNEAAIIIRKIAREGRKFENGLIIITQRPAYVSKDVLTQCCTQAIFRLINGNDINAVIEVVEGIGRNEAFRLPHYVQGQCIFTGVAIESPVVVRVDRRGKCLA